MADLGLPDQPLLAGAVDFAGVYYGMSFFGNQPINESDRQFIILYTSTVILVAVIQLRQDWIR